MFDMSWGEVMLIGGVALIVIGPKELPRALRTVGQMTTKVRRLAGEFQSQFNEAMREAELEDVKKEVEGLNRAVSSATTTAFNPLQTIRDELKGAVDGPIPPAATAAAGAALPPLAEPPIEEAGPIPQIEPLADLSPLAVEPAPATPLVSTGAGLEPGTEPAAGSPSAAGAEPVNAEPAKQSAPA